MTYLELIKTLRQKRIQNNENQQAVAKRARRQQSVISDLETGVTNRPRLDTLVLWARALGYRIKFVLEPIDGADL